MQVHYSFMQSVFVWFVSQSKTIKKKKIKRIGSSEQKAHVCSIGMIWYREK